MKQVRVRESESQTLTEAMVNLEGRLIKIEEMVSAIYNGFPSPTVEDSDPTPDPYPLLTIGLELLGFDEDEHREELMTFFENNSVLLDPSAKPWCAGYIDALLGAAGYDQLGSLTAKDYFSVGEESEGAKGDLCCWRNHVAVYAGRVQKSELAKLPTQKITSLSVWEELEDDAGDEIMVLGGNQSDECNISPRRWYDNYSKFLGFRKVV